MKKLLLIFFTIGACLFINAQSITGKLVDQNSNGISGKQIQLYISPKVYTSTTGSDGTFTFNNIVSVREESLPTDYTISANFPNPFNPKTRINFSLLKASTIRVELFNALGQKVRSDLVRSYSAGNSYIDMELKGLTNGIYYARINIDEKYTVMRKLMLLYGSQHLKDNNNISAVELSKVASIVGVLNTKIDSIVVTSTDLGRRVFKNLPVMTGSSFDVGKLIVTPFTLSGFVYDLDTKYGGKFGVSNMIAYLKADPTKQVDVVNGQFALTTYRAGHDTLMIVGKTKADTAFYFWMHPELDIQSNLVVKAFNDTTGIPMMRRGWDIITDISIAPNQERTNARDYLQFMKDITNVSNKWPSDPIWKQTTPRFKDNLNVKVYLNRAKAPNNWYADSSFAGLKQLENERLHFVETPDSESAYVIMSYTNVNVGNGSYNDPLFDSQGPYLDKWFINIRGPLGNNFTLAPGMTPYVVAHEGRHALYTSGNLSSFISDLMYPDVTERYDQNIKDFGSPKEKITDERLFKLERNPKLLWYYK